jgi:hypothetical protein
LADVGPKSNFSDDTMPEFKPLVRTLVHRDAPTSPRQAEQTLNGAMQQLHCGHAKAFVQLLIDDAYLSGIETMEDYHEPDPCFP